MSTELIITAIVFALLYLAFLFWYGGKGKPLTVVEVEALLAEIKKRAGKPDSEEESPILQQFRDLTQNDDGREYYMVNLLKFSKKALYPEGSSFGDDPLAANDCYNRAIIPLLLKHGGHPVFSVRCRDDSFIPTQPMIGIRLAWCAIAAAGIC